VVQNVALDRQTIGLNERTGLTIGATAVRTAYGYDGNGVGVAIIDSGAAASHDDLGDPSIGSRVVQFVWGTDDDETVVWGTSCSQPCEPVIWNR
jgi:subtilisin family serine protease